MFKQTKTKSPLKAKPLRNPGQSLDEQIETLLNDKITPWILVVIVPIVLAGLEWFRWSTQKPYNPGIYTATALVTTAIGVWKLRRFRRELQLLRLGRDGEKAVGQFLEDLRKEGYKIFHDIRGEGFNIDHVVIGSTGIYSIETKTFSKPVNRNTKIFFDGDSITKGGFQIGRDPVVQARAQSKWLSELLEGSTGRKNWVRPVVLFPGWFVESGWQPDVWVLNPKSLKAFMKKQTHCLSEEDVALFSFHLSRFVRAS